MATVMKARSGIKRQTISAVVIRADGTREDLGIISYHDKSFFARLWFKLRRAFGAT